LSVTCLRLLVCGRTQTGANTHRQAQVLGKKTIYEWTLNNEANPDSSSLASTTTLWITGLTGMIIAGLVSLFLCTQKSKRNQLVHE